mmetsp:Transcript_87906/g.160936  ORF Transcript_87906/g.160936 Transcript_87906/m.160936 type:complete len:1181 (-) Transcript_87906:111-3653(-)
MSSSCVILMLLSLGTAAATGTDNVCNDSADGPQACSRLSDEISMMQGGMRVSHSSNLEAVVQKAVQEAVSAQNEKIASWEKLAIKRDEELRTDLQHKDDRIAMLEKTVLERAEEFKQKNNQLSADLLEKSNKIAVLEKVLSERADEFKQRSDQLSKRNEELNLSNEQMQQKLNQQEKNHEELRKEHRFTYGTLLQVCEKGLRGLARTSQKRANVTGAAMGATRKFAPDVVDATVDAANTVADVAEDGYNAVEDGVNSAVNSIEDLAGDVGDWTLEQLESLKSLIGLNWRDIPGLSDAIETVEDAVDDVRDFAEDAVDAAVAPINDAIDWLEGAVDDVKDFAVEAVNSAVETIEEWIATLEEKLTEITDYVADLYNKYLKPIITFIWDCADNAKNPVDFIICVIKPVIEKIIEALVPTGDVAEKVPFPFDDEALQIDPETGVYSMKQTCIDCVEGDMRDLAPLKCQQKEINMAGLVIVTAHACNIPFMPGQCGGSLTTCVKQKAKECGRGAILWAPSGVLSKLSVPVQNAMDLGTNLVEKTTHWASEARALYEKLITLGSSTAGAVQDVVSNFMSAVDNAVDAKDSVVSCLKAVGQLTSASSLSKMVKAIEKVISTVEEIIASIEKTLASVEAVQTGIDSLSSSTEAEVQAFYTQATADMQALKSDIETTKNDLMLLYTDSKGVADELLEDFQAAVAAPLDQLESLGNFFQKCATARMSYQKVYVELEVASVIAARLALHERDGVKLAFIQPQLGGAELVHEEWPWSDLETKTGQELQLCVFVYCLKFQIKLQKNPGSILGLPVNVNDGLDALKWFELEYREMFYDLGVIGIPYKFTDPTGIRIPSIILPFLVDTSVPAQNPTSNPTDDLNLLWQKVVDNQAEAQQIADGQVAAPSLPAGAASAEGINQVKAEVDGGLQLVCGDSEVKAADTDLQPLSSISQGEQFVPMVSYQGTFYPICGHWFWNDDNGASAFCRKLGFTNGIRYTVRDQYSTDALMVGTCSPGTTNFTNCNKDFGFISSCNAGSSIGVRVSCKTTSSCDEAVSQACGDGDVKAGDDSLNELPSVSEGEWFVPFVYASGAFYPICGHWFWNDDGGATAVCKKLGFASGTHSKTRVQYSMDAASVGRCSGDDLTSCDVMTFGVNNPSCTAGNSIGVKVSCSSETAEHITSTCDGYAPVSFA